MYINIGFYIGYEEELIIDYLKKVINYIIYFKYIGGSSGQVGFDGFEILWPKPNPTRYQKSFCSPTQPTKP